jgi:transcriptional regulator with XRE-family HTH domain
MDPIIEQLRAARLARGMTLQQIGEAIGRKTYQSVWQWESGVSDLRLTSLRRWADALGYDLTLVRRDGG